MKLTKKTLDNVTWICENHWCHECAYVYYTGDYKHQNIEERCTLKDEWHIKQPMYMLTYEYKSLILWKCYYRRMRHSLIFFIKKKLRYCAGANRVGKRVKLQ